MKGKAFIHRNAKTNCFPTPYSMTRQFLEQEHFDFTKTVLEPACGDGHMVKVLQEKFQAVKYYDIQSGESFYDEKNAYDYIITNPPYGEEADLFVKKAKEVAREKFALLLRTNYLSGEGRYRDNIYQWLKTIYIFTRMTDFRSELRADGKYGTAGIVYAWMVWEIGYTGTPTVRWISNQEYVLKKKEEINDRRGEDNR